MNPLDRLREIHESDWHECRPLHAAGLALFAAICAYFAHTGDGWVPLLDGANLAFHEAGHPIAGLFLGERAVVYGGTFAQLVFPAVVAVRGWLQREIAACALGVVWLCENLWNIARYMADARARMLPLVGGGDHDWTEILTRWGVLHLDGSLAGLVRLIGWLGMLAVLGWVAWRVTSDRELA
jgi:hypothetical protein